MATINTSDPEKGLIQATARPTLPSPSSSTAPDSALPTHTSLELFQYLVGIRTPPSLSSLAAQARGTSGHARADNVGLYQRTRQLERANRLAFMSTSFISNTLYMLQILLAATFTALSAYKDSNPVTLTVLGAINTVVAGSLAWQKGQGVPQRYRKAQDQYQALLLEIEMTERSFLDPTATTGAPSASDPSPPPLCPAAERARLQNLFDVARADEQANYPDLYVSTGATATKDKEVEKKAEDEKKEAMKQLEEVKAEAARVQGELVKKIDGLVDKLVAGGAAAVVAAGSGSGSGVVKEG